ncbi:MAG: S-layer homology domain-containing protein [Bacillota bacterium]|nr:S-layer homology domain-containing protein [Bacillota bacterium]
MLRLWRKPFLCVVALVVAVCVGGTAAFALPAWKLPLGLTGGEAVKGQAGTGVGLQAKGHVKGSLKLKDIQGHWSEEAVLEARAQGLISGYPDLTFQPNKPVTHLEALVILSNVLAQDPQVREESRARAELRNRLQFRHQIPAWALDALAVAVEQGLVTEEELADLRPNQPAKRWEIARYLVRALSLENQVQASNQLEVQFRDAAAIPPGIEGYIDLVFKKQLMVGMPGGLFQPQKPVTRAEIAALIVKLQDLLKDLREDLRDVLERYYVEGTVTAVSDNAITVEKEDGTSVALEVSDDTSIFFRGRSLTLDGIEVGDEVRVFVKDGAAVFIRVLSQPERDRERDRDREQDRDQERDREGKIEGTLRAVIVVEGKTYLTVEQPDGKVVTYQLAAGARIEVDGEAGSVTDLEPGQSIELEIEDNVITEVEAEGSSD